MSAIDDDAKQIVEVLNFFGVEYVLVGGVALQTHGVPHVTTDVDVVIAAHPGNRQPLGRALGALRAEQRAVGRIGQSFITSHGVLDVLDYTDGLGDYEAWNAGAQPTQLGDRGPTVRVGSLADIKRDKTLIARGKDTKALELIERFEQGDLEPTPAALLLGPRPSDPATAQRWDVVARMVERFREQHEITTPQPLGAGEDAALADGRKRILRLAELIAPPDLGLEPTTDLDV